MDSPDVSYSIITSIWAPCIAVLQSDVVCLDGIVVGSWKLNWLGEIQRVSTNQPTKNNAVILDAQAQ